MDREKLIYDLSLMYVQEVVRHTDYKVVEDLAQYGGSLFYGTFAMAWEYFSLSIPDDGNGGTGEM